MTIKTSSAKAKGRRLQDYVRDKLRALRPSLHPSDIQSQPMGQAGADIITTQAARAVLPVDVSVECKAYSKFSVLRHFDQCVKNTEPGQTSLLVLREDRGKAMVVITLDHYLELLRDKEQGLR